MAEDKITIFDILAQIDQKDIHFYENLPEQVQKAEHPLVLMKWMSGSNDPLKIILLNELVNPYVFNLHKHKRLVMKLLTTCANGKKTRYKWTKLKSAKGVNQPKLIGLIKQTYSYSTRHAISALPLFSNAQLLEMAIDLGYQKQELTAIKAELRKRKS